MLIAMIIGLGFIFKGMIEKQERLECEKWQEWAEEYPNFYLTEWQKDQCEYHQIIIEVPIKTLPALDEPKYREIFATIYAYSSEVEQTDSDPFTMASGNRVYDGAIANNCLEFGTKVIIYGLEYTVEDRMNKRYGSCDIFDIWMPTKEQAIEWGKVGTKVKIYDYNIN